MSLQKEIDDRRKEIHSDRLSMSLGELESLYERNEVDIHPKFQRVLRWTDQQKSRLIESLLLRIPVPPIFVAQDESGKWDVVDGVQRLGTCFEFLGVLKDPAGNLKPPLVLAKTDLLPTMAGLSFAGAGSKGFPPALQRDFRRLRVDINIILKESDQSAKYELFERLNTGGSIASQQEVRNCVLVWMDESLFDWVQSLSTSSTFVAATPVSDRLHDERYRDELALRVLTLGQENNKRLSSIGDINGYLNENNRQLGAIYPDKDRAAARTRFDETFELILKAAGDDAFRRFDPEKKTFGGPFLISAFEAVALGVWHNYPKWSKHGRDAPKKLKAKIKRMWSNESFLSAIGIGKAAKSRIPKTVTYGRRAFLLQ
jgi:hypothetical protein